MENTTLTKKTAADIGCRQLKVTSTAFQYEDMIPFKYSCDAANVNPPLDIEDIPQEAKSMAVILENTDTPSGTWAHWVVWNMPVMGHIKEYGMHGTEGMNDFHQQRYIGPVPSFNTHRYVFKVYALDSLIYLPPHATKAELEKAMSEHIIAYGELTGLYKNSLTKSFGVSIAHHN
jgi:Raf kinase inhibitor-like YbhB/YbcL family protein